MHPSSSREAGCAAHPGMKKPALASVLPSQGRAAVSSRCHLASRPCGHALCGAPSHPRQLTYALTSHIAAPSAAHFCERHLGPASSAPGSLCAPSRFYFRFNGLDSAAFSRAPRALSTLDFDCACRAAKGRGTKMRVAEHRVARLRPKMQVGEHVGSCRRPEIRFGERFGGTACSSTHVFVHGAAVAAPRRGRVYWVRCPGTPGSIIDLDWPGYLMAEDRAALLSRRCSLYRVVQADDGYDEHVHRAERDNRLCVHRNHPLSGMPPDERSTARVDYERTTSNLKRAHGGFPAPAGTRAYAL